MSDSQTPAIPQGRPPSVSVLMTMMNGMPYLPEAVQSLRRQTLSEWELVAVVHGSTDGSARWLESLGDARVRVLRYPAVGISAAANLGLAVCRAALIARFDSDDVAEPHRLETQVRFLESHPEIDVVGAQATFIDGEGREIGRFVPPTDPDEIRRRLFRQNCMMHTTAIFRKAVLERAGGYNPMFPTADDYELFLRLTARVRMANLPAPLMRYRVHPGQVTNKMPLVNAALCYTARMHLVREGLGPPGGALIALGLFAWSVVPGLRRLLPLPTLRRFTSRPP